MTSLIFYDSLDCIGGNKIVVESENGSGLLLDFGFNFGMANQYLVSPFLDLRKQRILFDGFKTGFLPISKGILQGIYRTDLYKYYKDEIENLYDIDLSAPPKITHVLISHGHSDHIGYIKYLNQSIIPVSGRITAEILKYYNEVYDLNSNFTGILNYKPFFQKNERGYREYKDQIEKKRKLIVSPDNKFIPLDNNSDFLIAFYPTDHSLLGAGAYLIHDRKSKKRIIYSGDLRLHGPNSIQVEKFIEAAKKFKPDALIIEGTRIDSDEKDEMMSEKKVEEKLTSFLKNIQKKNPSAAVFFECSRRDMFRFQSFYQAAKKSRRKLVIKAKTFYLLKTCKNAEVKGLDRIDLNDINVYLPRKSWRIYEPRDYKYYKAIQKTFINPEKFEKKKSDINRQDRDYIYDLMDFDQPFVVKAADISKNPEKYLMYMDLFTVNELTDINQSENFYYIQSKSEWDDPKSILYEEKKKNWLELFNFKEENIFKAHCSGHISPKHLKDLITKINPKKIYPIHTLNPHGFFDLGLPESIEIVIAKKEEKYKI